MSINIIFLRRYFSVLSFPLVRRGGSIFLKRLSLIGITLGLIMGICTGCAAVKPFEREQLTDPLIEPNSQMSKQSLDQKFFTSREGSIGGADGIGGGCGCAK